MSKSSQRVHVILRIGQYEALVAKSQVTGATVSELIRRAVDASIVTKKVPK